MGNCNGSEGVSDFLLDVLAKQVLEPQVEQHDPSNIVQSNISDSISGTNIDRNPLQENVTSSEINVNSKEAPSLDGLSSCKISNNSGSSGSSSSSRTFSLNGSNSTSTSCEGESQVTSPQLALKLSSSTLHVNDELSRKIACVLEECLVDDGNVTGDGPPPPPPTPPPTRHVSRGRSQCGEEVPCSVSLPSSPFERIESGPSLLGASHSSSLEDGTIDASTKHKRNPRVESKLTSSGSFEFASSRHLFGESAPNNKKPSLTAINSPPLKDYQKGNKNKKTASTSYISPSYISASTSASTSTSTLSGERKLVIGQDWSPFEPEEIHIETFPPSTAESKFQTLFPTTIDSMTINNQDDGFNMIQHKQRQASQGNWESFGGDNMSTFSSNEDKQQRNPDNVFLFEAFPPNATLDIKNTISAKSQSNDFLQFNDGFLSRASFNSFDGGNEKRREKDNMEGMRSPSPWDNKAPVVEDPFPNHDSQKNTDGWNDTPFPFIRKPEAEQKVQSWETFPSPSEPKREIRKSMTKSVNWNDGNYIGPNLFDADNDTCTNSEDPNCDIDDVSFPLGRPQSLDGGTNRPKDHPHPHRRNASEGDHSGITLVEPFRPPERPAEADSRTDSDFGFQAIEYPLFHKGMIDTQSPISMSNVTFDPASPFSTCSKDTTNHKSHDYGDKEPTSEFTTLFLIDEMKAMSNQSNSFSKVTLPHSPIDIHPPNIHINNMNHDQDDLNSVFSNPTFSPASTCATSVATCAVNTSPRNRKLFPLIMEESNHQNDFQITKLQSLEEESHCHHNQDSLSAFTVQQHDNYTTDKKESTTPQGQDDLPIWNDASVTEQHNVKVTKIARRRHFTFDDETDQINTRISPLQDDMGFFMGAEADTDNDHDYFLSSPSSDGSSEEQDYIMEDSSFELPQLFTIQTEAPPLQPLQVIIDDTPQHPNIPESKSAGILSSVFDNNSTKASPTLCRFRVCSPVLDTLSSPHNHDMLSSPHNHRSSQTNTPNSSFFPAQLKDAGSDHKKPQSIQVCSFVSPSHKAGQMSPSSPSPSSSSPSNHRFSNKQIHNPNTRKSEYKSLSCLIEAKLKKHPSASPNHKSLMRPSKTAPDTPNEMNLPVKSTARSTKPPSMNLSLNTTVIEHNVGLAAQSIHNTLSNTTIPSATAIPMEQIVTPVKVKEQSTEYTRQQEKHLEMKEEPKNNSTLHRFDTISHAVEQALLTIDKKQVSKNYSPKTFQQIKGCDSETVVTNSTNREKNPPTQNDSSNRLSSVSTKSSRMGKRFSHLSEKLDMVKSSTRNTATHAASLSAPLKVPLTDPTLTLKQEVSNTAPILDSIAKDTGGGDIKLAEMIAPTDNSEPEACATDNHITNTKETPSNDTVSVQSPLQDNIRSTQTLDDIITEGIDDFNKADIDSDDDSSICTLQSRHDELMELAQRYMSWEVATPKAGDSLSSGAHFQISEVDECSDNDDSDDENDDENENDDDENDNDNDDNDDDDNGNDDSDDNDDVQANKNNDSSINNAHTVGELACKEENRCVHEEESRDDLDEQPKDTEDIMETGRSSQQQQQDDTVTSLTRQDQSAQIPATKRTMKKEPLTTDNAPNTPPSSRSHHQQQPQNPQQPSPTPSSTTEISSISSSVTTTPDPMTRRRKLIRRRQLYNKHRAANNSAQE